MLIVEIGSDGIIESWGDESGTGQVFIDGCWYQVDNDGEITEMVVIH